MIEIEISVIICTYNRANSLLETLESLQAMEIPDGLNWDILVVDNNSTDNTRKVVEEFTYKSELNVNYFFEPRKGLSYARNLGINNTNKEYIAFTDDDILVDSNWLKFIVESFQKQNADCIGGKILPYWLGKRPEWLDNSLLNILAMLDYGDNLFIFDSNDNRILYGANFSFKKEPLVEMGLFNIELGKKGSHGSGEDQDILEKLKTNKKSIVYNPKIIVWHKVYPERLTKGYFRKWHYFAGKDRARITKNSKISIFGIEGYLIREFAHNVGGMLAAILKRNWNVMFKHELKNIFYLSIFQYKIIIFLKNLIPKKTNTNIIN